jgi:phosphatidylinositol glycan class V
MSFTPLFFAPSAKLLVALFVFWKVLLLVIVYLNPNDGYDSSTQLFLLTDQSGHRSTSAPVFANANVSTLRIVASLSRWDAIYFAAAAHRGYVHEQEWAFSWGFTSLLNHVTATLRMFCSTSASPIQSSCYANSR